jgi:hypothetical protein
VSRIPREARDGLMRAWLEILRDRHPSTMWMPVEQEKNEVLARRAGNERRTPLPARTQKAA